MTSRQALHDAERIRVAMGQFVRKLRAVDTTPAGQAAVLGYLARSGPLSITDLAELVRVRHQSMARTVKLLEAAGHAEVQPDPADRRRVLVLITREGTTRLRAERLSRASWIARAMHSQLDDSERDLLRQLPAILDKLTADDGS